MTEVRIQESEFESGRAGNGPPVLFRKTRNRSVSGGAIEVEFKRVGRSHAIMKIAAFPKCSLDKAGRSIGMKRSSILIRFGESEDRGFERADIRRDPRLAELLSRQHTVGFARHRRPNQFYLVRLAAWALDDFSGHVNLSEDARDCE